MRQRSVGLAGDLSHHLLKLMGRQSRFSANLHFRVVQRSLGADRRLLLMAEFHKRFGVVLLLPSIEKLSFDFWRHWDEDRRRMKDGLRHFQFHIGKQKRGALRGAHLPDQRPYLLERQSGRQVLAINGLRRHLLPLLLPFRLEPLVNPALCDNLAKLDLRNFLDPGTLTLV